MLVRTGILLPSLRAVPGWMMVKMCFIQTVKKQVSYKNAYFKRNDICTRLSYILVHCMLDRLQEFNSLLCTIKSITCYKDPCEIANSRKGLPGSIKSLTNQNVLLIITILIRDCTAWSTIKNFRALVKNLSGFDAFSSLYGFITGRTADTYTPHIYILMQATKALYDVGFFCRHLCSVHRNHKSQIVQK